MSPAGQTCKKEISQSRWVSAECHTNFPPNTSTLHCCTVNDLVRTDLSQCHQCFRIGPCRDTEKVSPSHVISFRHGSGAWYLGRKTRGQATHRECAPNARASARIAARAEAEAEAEAVVTDLGFWKSSVSVAVRVVQSTSEVLQTQFADIVVDIRGEQQRNVFSAQRLL